jgi:hypothetical protein
MAEPPPRPRNESRAELGFTPAKRMVPWLSPGQLVSTNVRVMVSHTFGAYSDKREVQASLAELPPHPYTDGPELWIDFVADLGDAFGPTYAVASLLAQPRLDLSLPGGEARPTRRGRVLVMGGDEVYPTATIEGYENQTLGPYRAALPWVDRDPPDLYAIPATTTGTTGSPPSCGCSAPTSGWVAGARSSPGATSPSSCPTVGGCGASTPAWTTTSTSPSSATSTRRWAR